MLRCYAINRWHRVMRSKQRQTAGRESSRQHKQGGARSDVGQQAGQSALAFNTHTRFEGRYGLFGCAMTRHLVMVIQCRCRIRDVQGSLANGQLVLIQRKAGPLESFRAPQALKRQGWHSARRAGLAGWQPHTQTARGRSLNSWQPPGCRFYYVCRNIS